MGRVVKHLILGVVMVAGVATIASGQDMTTLLTRFLNGLYSGYIRMTDGSATAPAYSFSSATGMGAFYNAGSLAVAIGGVRKAELNSTSSLSLLDDSAQIVLGSAQDTVISRRAANEIGLSAVAFASLGTPANGTFAYCSDCTTANPCAGSGTGALAKRLNAVWVCN